MRAPRSPTMAERVSTRRADGCSTTSFPRHFSALFQRPDKCIRLSAAAGGPPSRRLFEAVVARHEGHRVHARRYCRFQVRVVQIHGRRAPSGAPNTNGSRGGTSSAASSTARAASTISMRRANVLVSNRASESDAAQLWHKAASSSSSTNSSQGSRRIDGTLSGPTSLAWFDHWRRYLNRQGVGVSIAGNSRFFESSTKTPLAMS